MKCCGEDRTTPFCPQCGDDLRPEHPLVELHDHVQRTARAAYLLLQRFQEYAEEKDRPESQKDHYWQKANQTRERFAKWQAWADALESAIQSLPDKAPGGV